MSKVLTITVPSYNVEKFLENTLDSFLDERILEDLEVLIVDDGSKDKTAEIGKQYQDKYPDSFRVISKKTEAMAPPLTGESRRPEELILRW